MLQMIKRAAASVASAAAGKLTLFFDTDGLPKVKDESGTVTSLKGAKGDTGDPGVPGVAGADGVGMPAGGSTGQVARKVSGADYDIEWATVAGTGDVVGPASSTANHIALFVDGTGKALKDGGALAAVATSNSYDDLDDKPSIPAAKTRQSAATATTLTLQPTDEFAALTALTSNLTLTTTGTWTEGDAVLIEINASGADRTLTWDTAKFVGLGGTLPTTAKNGKVMALAGYYSNVSSKIHISLPAAVMP